MSWISNEDLVAALGLSERRALLSNGTIFSRQIEECDAAMMSRHALVPGASVTRANGGQKRMFNRRAMVIACMRTDTVNAAAFRFWLATRVAEEVAHG